MKLVSMHDIIAKWIFQRLEIKRSFSWFFSNYVCWRLIRFHKRYQFCTVGQSITMTDLKRQQGKKGELLVRRRSPEELSATAMRRSLSGVCV